MTDAEMIAWLWAHNSPAALQIARRLEALSRIEQARAGKVTIVGTLERSQPERTIENAVLPTRPPVGPKC